MYQKILGKSGNTYLIARKKTLICQSLVQFAKVKRYTDFTNSLEYVGDGGLWEWCSSCYSYIHAMAAVPEWWSEPTLEFDPVSVRHTPAAFETALGNGDRLTH
jgi:hypothetical protein